MTASAFCRIHRHVSGRGVITGKAIGKGLRRRHLAAGALVLFSALFSAIFFVWPVAAEPRKLSTLRFLDGEKIIGVLRPSPFTSAGAQTVPLQASVFVVFRAADQRIYEGVISTRADGVSALGAFWPEGLINTEEFAGFIDLRLDEDNTEDSTEGNIENGARGVVSFLSGEKYAVKVQ